MSLPVAPAGTIRISLLHTSNGKQWQTNVWAKQAASASPTVTQLNDFADSVGDLWEAQIVPAFTTHTSFFETLCEWHDGSGNIIVGVDQNPTSGTDSGGDLPLSICMVLSWRIAAAYRGGKPRSYLSGMSESKLASNPNSWSSGEIAAFSAGAAAVLAGVNALSLASQAVSLGELSYYEDAAERGSTPPPVLRSTPLFRAFTGVIAKPLVGHQRRRDRP